ncbi:hypothetical protein Ple7327_0510 [Pleurocapsa sp. PCC 7327]|nr:hypothetical protein Ple7327_0510 [Pleurocapsa sp. PCC 7327]
MALVGDPFVVARQSNPITDSEYRIQWGLTAIKLIMK